MPPPAAPNPLRRTALAALLLASLAPAAAAALPLDVPLRALVRDTYRDRDGLPQNAIRALLHGVTGELWVGTDEGLGRYDGGSWSQVDRRTEPGLTSDIVTSLAETRDGTMWVGTYDGGLVRRRAGRFEPVDVAGAPEGLRVTALAADREGGLWVASHAGVFHLAGGRLRAYTMAQGLPDDRASAVAVDRDGTAWVSLRRGVARVVDGRVEAGPPELAGVATNCLQADPSGGVWLGTADRGVAHVGPAGVTFTGPAQGLPSATVTSLALDREGALWVGTQTSGLARLRAGRVERLSARDGLAGGWISGLLEDREGSIWVGTQDAGLIRLRQADFLTLGAAEGLSSDAVESILQTRGGDLWLATGGGVDVLRGGALPARRVIEGAPISLLEARDGAIWIGSYGQGLWRWKAGAVTRLTQGLPPNTWVRALAQDAEGTIWAAGTSGLFRVRGERLEPVDEGLPLERPPVVALAVTPGGLFVATEGSGLYRRGGGRFVREPGGPPDAWVVSGMLAEDDGTLWLATEGGGLWRRRAGGYARVSAAQGLPADTLWSILDDRRGALWISSNRGIIQLARPDLEAALSGRAARLPSRTWGMDQGLRSQEASGLSHPGGWRAADGRLWFATLRGASVVDPARLRPDPPPPETAFHAITVGGRSQPLAGPVLLPPGAGRVDLEYGARVLLAQRRASFRFRLDGLEDGWSEGRSGETQYTHLPQGRYRFEVQARLDEGAWGPVTSLELVQEAPAWRSTPALLGAGAALLLLAGLAAAGGVRLARARRAARSAALRAAEAEVRTLSALLPRCGWCHEPRGDAGYQAEVEAAMRARPASQFDGARCPVCAAREAGRAASRDA